MKKKNRKKKSKKIIVRRYKKDSKKEISSRTYASKNYDQKIVIKKIKKQAVEKRIYNVKDFIVYPKHGVGKIISVEKTTMGSIEISFYKVYIDQEKLTLSIPINQQSHLRPISSSHQVNKSIAILKGKPKVKRTMWSRRAQEYENKIKFRKNLRFGRGG